jgi:predicted TIM-barrel fold metal-dependent hydrolase
MNLDLISVDDHIIEPRNVWSDRLPLKYREQGPKVIEIEKVEHWVFEGQTQRVKRLDAAAGKSFSELDKRAVGFSDMRPGCYDPRARLKDMDLDGVRASLSFPTFPRLCGQRFLDASDKALAQLCVEAWNDFVLDEWCAADRNRFIPMILGPLWDPDAFAREIERCAKKGARALSFSENPAQLGLPSLHASYWDPVWRAASEANLPVCMHVGSSKTLPHTSEDAPRAIGMALVPVNSQAACTDIIMGEVPIKFPSLQFVLSEGGIGWVPFALHRADRMWERHRHWSGLRGAVPPSEVFRRNVSVCLIDDRLGIEARSHIGIDRILWECDYPHSESPWPKSQDAVADVLRGLPADEVAAITHGNAERLFRLS